MARPLRFLLLAAFVLTAGWTVVRGALLSAGDGGGRAAAAWPDHPQVTGAAAMREVALAAARGSEPPTATLDRFAALAEADPLAPDPFLAAGALAVRRGDYHRAEGLLRHARLLEPRSASARYLLADLYLRQGKPMPAMAEMSALNRLVPAGTIQLAQAFAQYSARAGAAPQVRAILSAYPELENLVLHQLSNDARNAPLVLALHNAGPARSEPPPWLPNLVAVLINAGQYREAYDAWRQVSGATGSPGALFNPAFDKSNAPPPFNWAFTKGSGAVVDPESGELQILYFGREDLRLAEQTLLLSPGRYRLAMQVAGKTGENDIRWTVECLEIAGKLVDLPLRATGPATAVSADFAVPAGCRIQRLHLSAVGREFPERADFRIGRMQLTRAGAR